MNRLFRLFAAAAIVATAAGCAPEDPENGQQDNTETKDVLSAPELTATASEGALAFSWTSGTIENSKLEVDYTLYVSKAGEDLFEKGVSFDVDGLTYTINGDDYTALLEDMGCQSGATVDMVAVVTATAGNETKTSAQKSFTVGLPEAEVVFPEALYMKGGACPGEWTEATVLNKTEEGVYEATEVTLMFGKLVDGKGFKFFVSEEPYPFYGQNNAEGAAFGDIKVFATENDGDSQFYPLQHDYVSAVYTVNVNLNTMKMTLTKTADVYEPQKPFYVFGEGLDHNWDMNEALKLDEIEPNVFEGQNIHLYKTSSFMFDNADWAEYQRDDTAGEYWTVMPKANGDVRFIPGDADPNFANGKYTVRLDLNTMKVTLTLTEADPVVESQYPTSLYMGGGFNGWGGLVELERIEDGKFKIENYEFNFFNRDDDPKGHGIKFFENGDWSGEWGPAGDFENENYRGWELKRYGSNAPQFYPQWMEMASGVYSVLVDFTTNTLTLTPDGSGEPETPETPETTSYIYLYGAAFADYTDWADWIPVPSVDTEIYETTLNLNVGDSGYARGFKIYKAQEDWSNEYCMYSDSTQDNIKFGHKNDTGDNQVIPFNVGYTESGNYVVRIDFNTMKITFTKAN